MNPGGQGVTVTSERATVAARQVVKTGVERAVPKGHDKSSVCLARRARGHGKIPQGDDSGDLRFVDQFTVLLTIQARVESETVIL